MMEEIMTKKKRFIAKINGEYIIDKKVGRDRKTGNIKYITFIPCPNIKSKGEIKFYEDEKIWLEENNTELECEAEDA